MSDQPLDTVKVKVCIDANDPDRLAAFYAALLGHRIRPVADADGGWRHLIPTRPGVPALTIQPVPEGKLAKDRLHLDVFVTDAAPAIARSEELGATRLHRSEDPDDWFQVMADPEGNEFCICLVPVGRPDWE